MTSLTQLRTRLAVGASALALGVSAALMTAPAAAQDTITWKVQSHWPGASSSYEDSLVRLKNVLAERTDGQLQLELYESGALFKPTETFNAVSRGILEMGTISPAYVQDKVSLAGVASGLPLAFHTPAEAAYFHMNMGFEEMLREEAAEHGVYWATDKVYQTEMVVKEPIESVEDLESLKVRSSGALQQFLAKAGASTTYITGAELYTALDSGIVDGAHWGAAQGAYSMSLYEVAKYHVKPALNVAGTDVFIVSQKALDALPGEMASTVKDALKEQFWFRTNEYEHLEKVTLQKAVREEGVKINTLPQDVQDQMLAAAETFWDEEAKTSDNAQKAVDMVKEYLTQLGRM
jgi:TRAP-type mannitol/chloroaromatic compound transport system substrate-binding protein